MTGTLLHDAWRFLTFRRMGPAVRDHGNAYLAFGLAFTWLAGVGRYWDNPRAEWWQHLGLGSLAYVLVLALLLRWLVAPLKPRHWTYRNVLLFVALTAPPAVLYAIPVERFMSHEAAVQANIAFLAVVATWRVALYAVFLRRTAALSWAATAVATLLPLTIIVVALTFLNLEHVVFDLMGGLREEDKTANDGAYGVVVFLTFWAMAISPVVLLAYLVLAFLARRRARP